MKKRFRIKKIKKLLSNMNDEQINRLCFILVHKIQLNIAEREMRNKKVMNEKRTEKEDKYGKI